MPDQQKHSNYCVKMLKYRSLGCNPSWNCKTLPTTSRAQFRRPKCNAYQSWSATHTWLSFSTNSSNLIREYRHEYATTTSALCLSVDATHISICMRNRSMCDMWFIRYDSVFAQCPLHNAAGLVEWICWIREYPRVGHKNCVVRRASSVLLVEKHDDWLPLKLI